MNRQRTIDIPEKQIRTIAVAPASGFNRQLFDAGCRIIEDHDFDVVFDDGIFDTRIFLAGDDRQRADLLSQALCRQNADLVWAARGGYGSLRILELLDKHRHEIARNAVPLLGFSDITILHSFLNEQVGVSTVHGPNMTSLSRLAEDDRGHLFDLLAGRQSALTIDGLRTVQPGRGHGMVRGGNVTSLCSLAGTRWQPDLSESILFLEETGEQPYRVDRMITQMRLSGMLDGVRGLLLGDISYRDRQTSERRQLHSEVIIAAAELPSDVPVADSFPAGHGTRNRAFLLGVCAELDAGLGVVSWGV